MEEWKNIVGFERYQVSNLGRIKNIDGSYKRFRKSQTYPLVSFWLNGKKVHFKVHRIVAEHFVDNPSNYACIDHLDADKWNPRADNLEWVDAKENSRRAKLMGLYSDRRGIKNPASKISTMDVMIIREVCRLFGRGTQKEVARYYNMSQTQICAIVQERKWVHI